MRNDLRTQNERPVPRNVAAALAVLDDVRPSGRGWVALCPAHDDQRASLSIGVGNSERLLLKCFAGCPFDHIIAAIAERQDDIRSDKKVIPIDRALKRRQADEDAPRSITLKELAEAKRLPVGFLRDQCRLKTGPFNSGVSIPYLDFDGQLIAMKQRFALKAKEGSKWPYGKPLAIYGEWRLRPDLRRNKGELFIVEGESDCWTLWYKGFAALGVPGANAFRAILRVHLIGVRRAMIIKEPDKGGCAFASGVAARLRELEIRP